MKAERSEFHFWMRKNVGEWRGKTDHRNQIQFRLIDVKFVHLKKLFKKAMRAQF